jgi:hypothetical protein
MNKLIRILILALAISGMVGCSTIKSYVSPSASTTKKNNPTKQYCTVLQKMVKAGKGVSQVGPGTAIVDATKALKRMEDAYSDLEKFSTNNPTIDTQAAKNAYQTFEQAVPTLSGDGDVGDPATQIRAALEIYNTSMNELVTAACPTK